MYEIDLSSVGAAFATFWAFAEGVLRLDADVFLAAQNQSGGTILAMSIALVAGVSVTLGQSVVLFANQVSRRRFLISLLLFAVGLLASIFFWAFSIWMVADLFFDAAADYSYVLILTALSYAPFIFGFLILLPYLGNIFAPVLRIWTLLALIVATEATFQFALWEAVLCAGLGWLFLELFIRFPISRFPWLDNLWWRLSTGTISPKSADEVVAQFVQETRAMWQDISAGRGEAEGDAP